MSSNDVYLKILPGKKLNTSEDLDEGIFIFPERENPFPLGEGMKATNLDSQYIA